MVVKRDGRRAPFDRQKVLFGIQTACRKLPISAVEMERAAEEVERALLNRLESECAAQDIGDMVMEQLLTLDPVAYVRFASVYHQFENPTQFRDIVEGLRKKRRKSG